MIRTDLALEAMSREEASEGIILEKSTVNGLPLTRVSITEKGTIKIGKPAGEYFTLFCNKCEKDEINALIKILHEIVPKNGRILIAGLGNENITPDSLGVRTVSRVVATAHLSQQNEFDDLGMREVFVIETGVLAQTGIESAEQLRYITNGIKPDMVIAVDSLACAEGERLGRTIQVTNTGIAPGSGVKNSRCEVSVNTLGIPVVAIGVPTVIDLESLTDNRQLKKAGAMVVPRDIDITINHYAKVISKALNSSLNPSLSPEELELLLF